jgi:hypothetical protein
VRRWQMESTFQEVRQRLGFETQRHWSETIDGDPAHGPSTFDAVLPGCALRASAEGANATGRAASGVVREGASDLLRRPGVGTKGAVGATRGDFLRVGAANRDGKSPAQVSGKADRCGLLCSIMAKVQPRDCMKSGPRVVIRYSSRYEKALPDGSFRCPMELHRASLTYPQRMRTAHDPPAFARSQAPSSTS